MTSELAEFKIFENIALNLYNNNQREELEKLRGEALTKQEALKYYYLTDLLGKSPEDNHLFKRGNSFLLGLKEVDKELKDEETKAKQRIMRGFLAEAQNFQSKNIIDAPYFRGVLIKYFPKFRDSGSQPVNKMSDSDVKKLFVELREYYKKQLKQYNY